MKHLKIYESFVGEAEPEIAMDSPENIIGTFKTESTEFMPTGEDQEGDYIVKFTNPEGEETTVSIGHSIDPEYAGKKMISSIEMIPDSSSDGREYKFIGYYDEIPGSNGAYELKKILIEE